MKRLVEKLESEIKKLMVLCIFDVVIMAVLFAGCCFYNSKLGRAELELESARVELAALRERQQQIRDITSRDLEIIRESRTTIQGIREQVNAIRESYEEMEALLNNQYSNNSSVDNNNNVEG